MRCWQENLLMKKVWVSVDDVRDVCFLCVFHFGILKQMNKDDSDVMLMKK